MYPRGPVAAHCWLALWACWLSASGCAPSTEEAREQSALALASARDPRLGQGPSAPHRRSDAQDETQPAQCRSHAAQDASCDGVDDDCNGATDDAYVPAATSCGIGACVRFGSTACVAGRVLDSCHAGAPASSDTTCDGVDDDCDGELDEDFVPTATQCGVGACFAHGLSRCIAGKLQDSCLPLVPAEIDPTCDGIDDDCDGVADDEFPSAATRCGFGACARAGATACITGRVVDSCAPGLPAVRDEPCDGVDEDCDGRMDEDCSPGLSPEAQDGVRPRVDERAPATPRRLRVSAARRPTCGARPQPR